MNRLVRPVMFAFEADVVHQFNQISFGAAGAATISALNSRGICGFARKTITSASATTNTSASVTGLTLVGVYNGMSVTGTGIPASTTVSSVNPTAGTLTLSNAATATGTPTLSFSGGQYTMTFGSQLSPARFDAYYKLLGLHHVWDLSANEALGTASSPSTPAAPHVIIVQNNINSATLANIVLQFGTLSTATFVAADPASGEVLRLAVQLCRSSAG